MRKIWHAEQPKNEKKTDPSVQSHVEGAPLTVKEPEIPTGQRTAQDGAGSGSRSDAARVRPRSVVGESMIVEGDLEAKEDLLIAGYLEGTVTLPEHCLTVAAKGRVKAKISTRSLVIEGVVEGDIDCSDSVVLANTARVTGDIRMRRLNVVDGAVLSGRITMLAPE